MRDKVSIVIPVYNGAALLGEAIQSAIDQTYPNCEIIVVNDGSDDSGETDSVAKKFGDRIRYFCKPNGGVASALNFAIRNMQGKWFSWLSHDDIYYPEKVEKQIEFADTLQSANSVVYSDYSVFTTDRAKAAPVRLQAPSPHDFRYWITVENQLHGCTLLIPKQAFQLCGVFNERLVTTQDYDLWFRMASSYQFHHLPHALVAARQHAHQGSLVMADTARKECDQLLARFVAELTPLELIRVAPDKPTQAYRTIISSMERRGFRTAAHAARTLAGESDEQLAHRISCQPIKRFTQGFKMCAKESKLRSLQCIANIIPKLKLKTWQILFHCRDKAHHALNFKFRKTNTNMDAQHDKLKTKFSEIYAFNLFGGSVSRSGEGSDLTQTSVIRAMLPEVVRQFRVKTLLDAPCGDWCWMQHTQLGVVKYIGVDIVDDLIRINQERFGKNDVMFVSGNLSCSPLPTVDMIFSRDCLVHLSFADCLQIINNFKKSGSKYLLTTTFTQRAANDELTGKNSFWRPLNLEKPPFNFPAPLLLIDEKCTEEGGAFADKALGLWMLSDIRGD